MAQTTPKIVVAGDIALDWLQVDCPLKEGDTNNWRKYPGYRWHQVEGGALLVGTMIAGAISGTVHTYNVNALKGSSCDTVLHSLARIGTDRDDKKDDVLRVIDYLGYSGSTDKDRSLPTLEDDPLNASIVVLDDAGNGFRGVREAWPRAITRSRSHPLVVLKMSQPLVTGKLWNHLLEKHADRLIVIISANDLRALGANISRRLSWERTVTDLAWQLTHNSKIQSLTKAKVLVIRLGIDGALVLQHTDEGSVATLLFDPAGYEDAYKDRFSGDMQGLTPAFVAALTRRLASDTITGVVDGVREGIIASRRLFRLGYGKDPRAPAYSTEIFAQPVDKDDKIERVDLPDFETLEDDSDWTILHRLEQTQLEKIAIQIVRDGVKALKKPVPVARFNNLIVVDRNEIESFQSIRNLLQEYVANAGISRPFSFAVFGPPGSGKSFGVSELSKGLTAEQPIEPMTFNLSQFESSRDLVGAFHLVRDAVLRGKLPLVFFDEFDATFGNQPLGWLRFFLAPMQDGVFRDGESIHPIGRAIFVFAGGTSFSFDKFDQRINGPEARRLKDAKATDFISRLRGRIDIRGCNPGPDDSLYLVRRALLLRSIIERTAKHLVTASEQQVQIDDAVLRAFLMVPSYRHGVRSMQAIVEMSMLKGRKTFEPASIPPVEQLALHVDAELFQQLMLQKILFDREIEPLAQAIHAEYLLHVKPGRGKNAPPMAVPWNSLPEEFRESNRNQARQIHEKLDKLKYGVLPIGMDVPDTVTEFSEEQVDILAIMEHDRWMEEKQRGGWVAGTVRDNDNKVHPDLVPWDQLDDVAREKDRNAVRTIPKLLELAGFVIYPLP